MFKCVEASVSIFCGKISSYDVPMDIFKTLMRTRIGAKTPTGSNV